MAVKVYRRNADSTDDYVYLGVSEFDAPVLASQERLAAEFGRQPEEGDDFVVISEENEVATRVGVDSPGVTLGVR